jgi:transmembrane sensor
MKRQVNKQVYEEASEWLVELRVGDVDAGLRERLDAWFRESPQHIRAFLELSSIWEDGGDPDLDRAHSTDELIARARGSSNVVALGKDASTKVSRPSAAPMARRHLSKPALAASVVGACLLTGAVGYWYYGIHEPSYATRTGEEKFIQLSDGSTVELNSRSRVRVRFSARERDVDLLEGQALFHVSKDTARPFVVHSDSTRVRAVGTQFDVYRRDAGTTVTVVEGRVAVLPGLPGVDEAPTRVGAAPGLLPAQEADAIILAAGEQVTVAPKTATKPIKADVATATAWTQHQLVFDSTPLADVALEFNRYNVRQLVVIDPALHDFHVTGVFSSADPSSLLKFLRAQRDVNVVETDREIRISKR